MYYVMSPSSTPNASPVHHYQIHHSRESTTGRFSGSLKNGGGGLPWQKLPHGGAEPSCGDLEEEEEEEEKDGGSPVRCYACVLVSFVLVFMLFSLILWGASKSYKPIIHIKSMVFESYNIQAGMDYTGVPTKMMTLNSTVRIVFYNPATFFGIHVSSSPLSLFFYDLPVASGHMGEFYQRRKSGRILNIAVSGNQIPLYGGGSTLMSRSSGPSSAVVPLNLTFVMRARAHVLGYLVKSKFYRRVKCSLYLRERRLGKPIRNIAVACEYHEGRK
ncbi:hypothetical protein LUZ60_016733 [Juncus effusus]|nr:hypothetical protein LUZ60_016733 [Juncus effusus]